LVTTLMSTGYPGKLARRSESETVSPRFYPFETIPKSLNEGGWLMGSRHKADTTRGLADFHDYSKEKRCKRWVWGRVEDDKR